MIDTVFFWVGLVPKIWDMLYGTIVVDCLLTSLVILSSVVKCE